VRTAFIIRVTRISELGTILVTLMMEAIRSSEISVLTGGTRRHIADDGIFHLSIPSAGRKPY
jgi:hypothetical protein